MSHQEENKKLPKISVIIHCFNREDYIAETIESIINQNYPNLECIIIDDGSTDKSWEIIQSYKDKVFYIEQLKETRDTPIHALNHGFSKSSGDIMTWINTKNILLPNSLCMIAELFTTFQQVQWMTGLATTINDRSQITNVSRRKKNVFDFLSGDWGVIQQESTFWTRSLWEKTGSHLSLDYIWSFDTALWVSFFPHKNLYHARTQIGAYRKIPQGQSIRDQSVFTGYAEKALRALRKQYSTFDIFSAKIYLITKKIFGVIFNRIPNKLLFKIPFIKKFYYKEINYDISEKKWKIETVSAFKNAITTGYF